MRKCLVRKLGRIGYADALSLQKEFVGKVSSGEHPPILLLLEHNPVITIGRKGGGEHITAPEEILKKRGVEVFETNRGGDVTFHGPGQLVGYPIITLEGEQRDIHRYLRMLEVVLIRALEEYQIRAERVEGFTGVWVENRKIAAIGVGVVSWVTFHGFALNVNTDLSYFDLIVPCGITDREVTSMQRELGREVTMKGVEDSVVRQFGEVFGFECIPI